jgi:hypothetical protein
MLLTSLLRQNYPLSPTQKHQTFAINTVPQLLPKQPTDTFIRQASAPPPEACTATSQRSGGQVYLLIKKESPKIVQALQLGLEDDLKLPLQWIREAHNETPNATALIPHILALIEDYTTETLDAEEEKLRFYEYFDFTKKSPFGLALEKSFKSIFRDNDSKIMAFKEELTRYRESQTFLQTKEQFDTYAGDQMMRFTAAGVYLQLAKVFEKIYAKFPPVGNQEEFVSFKLVKHDAKGNVVIHAGMHEAMLIHPDILNTATCIPAIDVNTQQQMGLYVRAPISLDETHEQLQPVDITDCKRTEALFTALNRFYGPSQFIRGSAYKPTSEMEIQEFDPIIFDCLLGEGAVHQMPKTL